MPVETSLVRMTVNCAKHKDDIHAVRFDSNQKVEKCPACEFLSMYKNRMSVIVKETQTLNSALEGFLRQGEIVAVDFGRKFMTAHV